MLRHLLIRCLCYKKIAGIYAFMQNLNLRNKYDMQKVYKASKVYIMIYF